MKHIIIIGRISDGTVFRPSNWTSRIAVGTFSKSKRLQYHKHITPIWIQSENVFGLRVNQVLQTEDPILYNHIISFAVSNMLRIDYGEKVIKEEVGSLEPFKERVAEATTA